MAHRYFFIVLLLFMLITGGISEITFNFDNNCKDTLWLASSPSDGDLDPESGPDTLEIFYMDDPWSGSIWVRTKCTSNDTYYFSCETGDCGSGERDCQGPPPVYPVTLLNFNISQNAVSYELSLVHGHNIAVQIRPDGGSLVDGGSGPCPIVECIGDISNVCPASLVVKNKDGVYVGCNNPCDVLNDPNYCRANDISTRFKQLCSSAHTYPGDNSPPIYKCSGATRYYITFCPVL